MDINSLIDHTNLKNTATLKDIEALPEGERAELIDGTIYYMATPNTKHQRLVMSLSGKIFNYIEFS